jgi:hypothetical protein
VKEAVLVSLGFSWKKDKNGDLDITVSTPVGTLKIHDNVSNNVNYNKRDNSKGKYRYDN